MRGTAIVLVCLIALHYLSVIDAYSVRFTSENGMLGGRHEDRYPRRSTEIKRSPSKSTFRDSGFVNHTSGDPPDEYDEGFPPGFPPGFVNHRSGDPPDEYDEGFPPGFVNHRSGDPPDEYDDSLPPGFPGHFPPEEISKIFQETLTAAIEALPQILEKWKANPSGNAGGEFEDADKKRNILRIANLDKETIVSYLTLLQKTANKALDIASEVIEGIDVENLEQKEKDLKKQTVGMLKVVKDALKEIVDSAVHEVGSVGDGISQKRWARSVSRRTMRNALESYLTSLKSQKRSMLRKTLLASKIRNAPMKRSDAVALPPDFGAKIDDCIRKMFTDIEFGNELQCAFLPFTKLLSSPGIARANALPMGTGSSVRFNKLRSHDSDMRKLNFPWGNIFLIPIYSKSLPNENIATTTTPPPPTPGNDSKFDNETTTPEPTTSTTELTTPSTTEANSEDLWPGELLPPEKGQHGSRYRSRYDNDY